MKVTTSVEFELEPSFGSFPCKGDNLIQERAKSPQRSFIRRLPLIDPALNFLHEDALKLPVRMECQNDVGYHGDPKARELLADVIFGLTFDATGFEIKEG